MSNSQCPICQLAFTVRGVWVGPASSMVGGGCGPSAVVPKVEKTVQNIS